MTIGSSPAEDTPAHSAARVLALRRGAMPDEYTPDELEFGRKVAACCIAVNAHYVTPAWLNGNHRLTPEAAAILHAIIDSRTAWPKEKAEAHGPP